MDEWERKSLFEQQQQQDQQLPYAFLLSEPMLLYYITWSDYTLLSSPLLYSPLLEAVSGQTQCGTVVIAMVCLEEAFDALRAQVGALMKHEKEGSCK